MSTINTVTIVLNSPLCPSRVWFIDRLLGAANPFTFTSFPVQKNFNKRKLLVQTINLQDLTG